MPAPTMTPEQRAAALEKARVVRAKRSEITNKLAMGLTTPAEVLDQIDDPIIGRMKVKAFVNALPGFGKVKTEKLMEELGIPAERRLQGLGSNQMAALEGRPFLVSFALTGRTNYSTLRARQAPAPWPLGFCLGAYQSTLGQKARQLQAPVGLSLTFAPPARSRQL